MVLFVLYLVLLVGGAMIVAKGRRGVRVDEHPICRQCGFDLFGLPAGVRRCSECGADLARAGARRMGHRQAVGRWITAGMVVAMAGVAGESYLVSRMFLGGNWIKYEPAIMLKYEALHSATIQARADAAGELWARLLVQRLWQWEINSIVESGLSQQADVSTTWVTEWGSFIEAAHAQGKLRDEQWKRYVSVALSQSIANGALKVREKVRRGDPLPAYLVYSHARTASPTILSVNTDVTRNGELLAEKQIHSSIDYWLQMGGAAMQQVHVKLDPAKMAVAKDGPQALHVMLDVVVSDSPEFLLHPGTPIVKRHYDFDGTWTLTSQDSVAMVNDRVMRADMEKKIAIMEVRQTARGKCNVTIVGDKLPMPCGFDVIVVAGERAWKVGDVLMVDGGRAMAEAIGQADGLTADRVDVILRPSAKPARETLQVTRVWNGELVFKNVKVVRGQTATSAPLRFRSRPR